MPKPLAPLPEGDHEQVRLNLFVPAGTLRTVDAQAAARGMDRSAMVRALLAEPPSGHVAVKPAGMEYLTRRAEIDGCTVDDVVKAALHEYSKANPLPKAGAEPAPMEDESGQARPRRGRDDGRGAGRARKAGTGAKDRKYDGA